MATVVVTIILRASFCANKMDADCKEKRGQRISQQTREKRWSMNSEKLAAIVQELMKPVSDLRHSFELDQSGLLESYLSEAGIHMYNGSLDMNVAINFTELALLVQYSTTAYCRKVDLLYNNVLHCSTSLQNSTIEMANSSDLEDRGDDEGGGTLKRRRRNDLVLDDFTTVELQSSTQATVEPGCSRPPPTLPRSYIELGPRAMTAGDTALADYAGEMIGLLTDYHGGWALRGGYLVEQLATQSKLPLRPIPLHELQQAIEARAPPPLEDITPPPTPPPDVLLPSPPPSPSPTLDSDVMPPPPPPAPAHKERKRKHAEDIKIEPVKLHISKEALKDLGTQEFSIPLTWQKHLIVKRSLAIVTMRRTLRLENPHNNFPGFDCDYQDSRGFPGWTEAEVSSAQSTTLQYTMLNNTLSLVRLEDSDDDGFFEQSSTDSDCPLNMSTIPDSGLSSASIEGHSEWLAWQARVVRRAHDQEAKGCDIRRLANTVLEAVSHCTHSVRDSKDSSEHKDTSGSDVMDGESDPVNSELKHNSTESGSDVRLFTEILRDTACEPTDVSRLFLATLFLANAGNVEIVQGKPLSVSSFGVRVLTKEDRLCSSSELMGPPSGDALPDVHLATSTPLPPPNKKRRRRLIFQEPTFQKLEEPKCHEFFWAKQKMS